MNVRVAVVRIFGTNDQYGDKARTRPPGLPLVFKGFPDPGASVRVEMGPVPSDVIEAERMRRAIGQTMVSGFFGGGDSPSGAEGVMQSFEEFDESALFGDYNWYTTLAVERTLNLTQRPGPKVDFFLPTEFWELGREAPKYAAPALDVVTSIISTVLDPGVFDVLVLGDRVHLHAGGRRPSGIPVFGGGGSASVTRGGPAPELLGRRVELLRAVDTSRLAAQEWLDRVAHWRVQSLRERDPWKRFLWSFLALEILTNKIFEARRDGVLGQLRLHDEEGVVVAGVPPLEELAGERNRAPLKSRFALVASDFFPESARDDVGKFALSIEARNRLTHGAVRDPDELPTGATQVLVEKYFSGAVKALLLGLDPKQSWEDLAAAGHVT